VNVLFVADQVVPPIINGSATVYRSWLEALASRHTVRAILFRFDDHPTEEAEAFLSRLCQDFLILPGAPSSPAWKTARAILRYLNGSLFASRWLEEWHRGPIKRSIRQFVDAEPCDVTLFSKLNSVHLFGERLIARMQGKRILDAHDDFVQREMIERRILPDLLRRHPVLLNYPPYGRLRLRHRLSRLVEARARKQERRLFQHFDVVLASAKEEHESYSANRLPGPAFAWMPWPVPPTAVPADRSRARFDAGFIASDACFNLHGFLFFAEQVLPLIRRRQPAFTMLIAGSVGNPLRAALPDIPGLTFAERIDNVRDFYENVRMVVTPLLVGTGVSLKTLEALGFGCPVVTTTVGARGLSVAPGRDLVVADSAEAFADAVVNLLRDVGRQDAIGRHGREMASAIHSVDAALARLDEIVHPPTSLQPSAPTPRRREAREGIGG
jgi:glycosyltransferase involved in cell wall biosynthesis